MAKLEGKLGLTACSDCEKLNIAMRAYNAFNWESISKIAGYDRKNETITIDETKLMRLIQTINPAQKERKITLI